MTAAEPIQATVQVAPARTGTAPPADPAGRGTKRVFFLTVLAAASVVFLYPFVWLVVASLKPRDRTFTDPFLPGRSRSGRRTTRRSGMRRPCWPGWSTR
nr:hypothetical protein GCM10020093_005210 [Planobispora longispora]